MSLVFTGLMVVALHRIEGSSFYGPLPFRLSDRITLVPFAGTLVASVLAIGKRRADLLLPLHATIVAIGMLATQFGIGMRPGDHVDPRYFAVAVSGVATIQSSYVMRVAHLAGFARSAFARRRGVAAQAAGTIPRLLPRPERSRPVTTGTTVPA